MGFVEPISGKLFHQIENVDDLPLWITALQRSAHEAFALRRHFFRILFSHRPPQQVGLTQRISCQAVGDLHHLLLIHDHAQRLFQDGFQFRQLVIYLPSSVLALDEIVDHAALDGSGTIERIQGGQVLYRIGLIAAQYVAHAVRFKLENA